jgi:hypothetical protein
MTTEVTETFFLPREIERLDWSVPPDVYNLYRSLLIRNKKKPVFVPIRSMQFMAVLDRNEILFIDSQSYAVSKNTGGRMILVAWQFAESPQRKSLNNPVSCELVFYEQKNDTTQLRLASEFKQAMELLDKRYRDSLPAQSGINIVEI